MFIQTQTMPCVCVVQQSLYRYSSDRYVHNKRTRALSRTLLDAVRKNTIGVAVCEHNIERNETKKMPSSDFAVCVRQGRVDEESHRLWNMRWLAVVVVLVLVFLTQFSNKSHTHDIQFTTVALTLCRTFVTFRYDAQDIFRRNST